MTFCRKALKKRCTVDWVFTILWHKSSQNPLKFCESNVRKIMATVFWDVEGISFVHLLLRRFIAIDACYAKLISSVRQAIKKREKLGRNVQFSIFLAWFLVTSIYSTIKRISSAKFVFKWSSGDNDKRVANGLSFLFINSSGDDVFL